MAEVVGAVAGVLSALVACESLVKGFRERRRAKRRVALLRQPDLAAENDFARSLIKGIRKIKRKWR